MSADRRSLLALTGVAALLAGGVAVATPAAAASVPFTDCGTNTPAHVTKIDVTPSPLKPGRNVTISLTGSLTEKVTGGTYEADVTYLGTPLLHTSGNLADVVHLPLPAGPFALRKKAKVPKQVPAGTYNLTLSAADQSKAQLLCVRVPFEVR